MCIAFSLPAKPIARLQESRWFLFEPGLHFVAESSQEVLSYAAERLMCPETILFCIRCIRDARAHKWLA